MLTGSLTDGLFKAIKLRKSTRRHFFKITVALHLGIVATIIISTTNSQLRANQLDILPQTDVKLSQMQLLCLLNNTKKK